MKIFNGAVLSLKTLTYVFQNKFFWVKDDIFFLSKKIQSLFQSPCTAAAFPPDSCYQRHTTYTQAKVE